MFDKKTIEKIRSQSAAMEKAGELLPFVLDVIYKEKLFKLFVPKKDSGKMASLPDAIKIIDEASYIDGNLGWSIAIGAGGGYFYAYMQPDTAKKVFSPLKAVIAGSGHPSAVATRVNGGYKVTGQWKYASGAPYATTFTANAMLKGSSRWLSFAFQPKQVKIIKDWNAFGLKATMSHSFKVDGVFVPDEMTFDLSHPKTFYDAPFYRYPFLQFAEASFAAVTVGLGRHFIEEANTILRANHKAWGINSARYNFAKVKVQYALDEMEKARDLFYDITSQSWKQMMKEGKLEQKLQAEVSKTCKQTSRIMLACSDQLIQSLGMQAVMQDSTINRVWRDIHTACQHVLLTQFE